MLFRAYSVRVEPFPHPLIPAPAGIQGRLLRVLGVLPLGPRFRGDERRPNSDSIGPKHALTKGNRLARELSGNDPRSHYSVPFILSSLNTKSCESRVL